MTAIVAGYVLPWPPKKLSPNGSRQHWGTIALARKRFRKACWGTALQQQPRIATVPDGKLLLEIDFAEPAEHEALTDVDNALAMCKPGIDGVCDALGIDDSRFERITISRAAPVKGGAVLLRIRSAP